MSGSTLRVLREASTGYHLSKDMAASRFNHSPHITLRDTILIEYTFRRAPPPSIGYPKRGSTFHHNLKRSHDTPRLLHLTLPRLGGILLNVFHEMHNLNSILHLTLFQPSVTTRQLTCD